MHKSNFTESKLNPEERILPEYEEYYLHEILCGKEKTSFEGIYPLIDKFMQIRKFEKQDIQHIRYFLDFLKARAKGEIPTGAKFIRDFIQ